MGISELKSIIEQGRFPVEHEHFGGAGLIITNDPGYLGHADDVVICTPHASALSWLVFQLKDIYDEKIDYLNKYDFYPSIGVLLKQNFSNEGLLLDAMLAVIDEIEIQWR